jgi:MarR family 2-MHQ and catechol resistance regulon transcriptional repressor
VANAKLDKTMQATPQPEWPEDPLHATALQYKAAFPAVDLQSVEVYLAFIRAMGVLTRKITRHMDSIGLGKTRNRYTVLRNLYFADGNKMPQSLIGSEMGVSKNSVTNLVEGLVQDGFVVRFANPSDRRIIYAQLTEEGIEFCQSLLPEVTAFMTLACRDITADEKVAFMNYLTRVWRSLEECPEPVDQNEAG